MLDTNVCIRVIRNRPAAVAARFQSEVDDLAISTIVWHELLHGAEKSDRPAYHREKAEDFATRLTILNFDQAAAADAANIKFVLGKKGQMIGPNDLLIAGHARSLGLQLITGNLGEFRRVDGLRCEDWLAEETE
ncbi:PIN domain-containing protein [Sphingomonas sp. SUN039]|uniref:PIN domain-containing protein n=1 Tax=Sphingomonas sp. SUN039 TaxID=2937787 RepID=UPI002164CF2C|nr:PIN domain-containing protein [Sphingomonas sp. SUN039]UVO54183.1 PIN domain-containing protein [Sphingomonas sp. SUN039]